jgi:two-component system sensor histidine kinase VicK
VGIVLILGVLLMISVRAALHQRLGEVLQRRGVSLARHAAETSLDFILMERYLQLDLMLDQTKTTEPDIMYIFILNREEKVLAHTFGGGFPAEIRNINPVQTDRPYGIQQFETERGEILDIAVPLLQGTAGTLHLGIAVEFLGENVRSIVRQILWIIAGMLIAGSIAIVVFTRTVTKRLLALEDTVEAMGRGDLSRRVAVTSDDEIGRLGEAFNAMADRRRKAEDDREKLIEDLRVALDNVKTLRGLIPICASCKRIRDDSGYWGQIEAYIARHSDAEFSHGICPECAEKLYPGKQIKKPKQKA